MFAVLFVVAAVLTVILAQFQDKQRADTAIYEGRYGEALSVLQAQITADTWYGHADYREPLELAAGDSAGVAVSTTAPRTDRGQVIEVPTTGQDDYTVLAVRHWALTRPPTCGLIRRTLCACIAAEAWMFSPIIVTAAVPVVRPGSNVLPSLLTCGDFLRVYSAFDCPDA